MTTSARHDLQAGIRRGGQAGSATVELLIVAPVLLMVLGLVIAGGRIQLAGAAVDQAAYAAARAGSLARTAGAAQAEATAVATQALAERGIECSAVDVTLDTGDFALDVGQPGTVRASVSCTASLSDIAVPGIPGSQRLHGTAASPIDQYRSRQ